MLTRQRSECHRQRVHLTIGEHDQRPHEVVPAAQECKYRQRHQHRLEHGQHDREEGAEFARAVHPRSLDQLVRDAAGVLPDQKNAEDAGQSGHQHARPGVDQAHALEHQEQRQHRHLAGNHQRSDEQRENLVAAGETQLGEGVAGQSVEESGYQRHRQRQPEAVDKSTADATLRKQLAIVNQRRLLRPQRRRQGAGRTGGHEGDRNHPDQWKDRQRRGQQQQAVDQQPGEPAVHAARPAPRFLVTR